MRGADRYGLRKSQPRKVQGKMLVFGRVHFVDDQDDRPARTSEIVGKLKVQRRGAILPVNHEKQDIRALYGGGGGLLRRLCKIGIGIGAQASRVRDLERDCCQSADCRDTIPRYARLIVNDRNPAAREPIEERGFADVRPPDDCDATHRGYRGAEVDPSRWLGSRSRLPE